MVRIYKEFNRSELQALEKTLESRLLKWAESWLGDASISIELFNATSCVERSAEIRRESDILDEGHCYGPITTDLSKLNRLLFRAAFDEDVVQETSCLLAKDLLGRFTQSLIRAIAGDSPLSGEKMQPAWAALDECVNPGSGWILAKLEVQGEEVEYLVSGCLLPIGPARETRMKPSCAKLLPLLVKNSVSFEAKLGDVSLSIGDFRSLRVGDVLILDAKVFDNVSVLSGSGEEVFRANLGGKQALKALRVLSR